MELDPIPTPRPAGSPLENGMQTGTAAALGQLANYGLSVAAAHYGLPLELVAPITVVLSGVLGWVGSWARNRSHAGDPVPASAVLTRVG